MAKAKSPANKIARLVGLALVVGACLFVLLWTPKEPDLTKPQVIRPAKLFDVETVRQSVSRSFTGVVKAANEVDLSFRVSGPLVQLPINRGKEVAEGDLIAQIDPRDFQNRLESIASQLEQAEAQLSAMKAGARVEVIAQLENQYRAAKADFENAQVELERYEQLFKDGVESQSAVDRRRLRRDTAEETMKAAEQQLAQGKKGARQEDIDAQEAQIRGLKAQKRDAENALADTSLKAPFAGLIARQFVENFQEVRAGEAIVSLQDVSNVEVVADIPEALVALGNSDYIERVYVTFESVGDREFDVEFKEMEAEADQRTQTYAVTVAMPAPDDVRLLKGMPAEMHIVLKAMGGLEEGVIVPVTAVFADEAGNPHVWLAKPTADQEGVFDVELKSVKVDQMSGNQILVLEGVQGGDTVVTAGVHFLDEETQIRRLMTEE